MTNIIVKDEATGDKAVVESPTELPLRAFDVWDVYFARVAAVGPHGIDRGVMGNSMTSSLGEAKPVKTVIKD